jgi:outer membrane cobalamin receptor
VQTLGRPSTSGDKSEELPIDNLAQGARGLALRINDMFLMQDASSKVMPFAALLLLTSVSGTTAISAQTTDEFSDSVMPLKEVLVTAKRPPIATVQSLSGAELQSLSTTSIADALKYFAGVQIKDYGGLGGLKTINVRSLGAQHVGVYIDGIRITNAQNGTVDLGKYSLST